MRRPLVILSVVIAIAVLATAVPAVARSPIAIGISHPGGSDLRVLDAHIAATGGQVPALWSLWVHWGERGGKKTCEVGTGRCRFPTSVVNELHARGIDPVLWWAPYDPAKWELGKYSRYIRIINGKHDKYIRTWAQEAKAAGELSGRPIIVRFAWEADGHWFPWSVQLHDNNKLRYKKAWRHIWRIFKQEGALPHVRFLWSPIWPDKSTYPGNQYVDYVGFTVLNTGLRKWTSMSTLLKRRQRLKKKATWKPIIIAELTSFHKGGDKAKWLSNGYRVAYEQHPKIKGILYLDYDASEGRGGRGDWRLIKPDDGSALAAYSAIAAKPKFQGHIK